MKKNYLLIILLVFHLACSGSSNNSPTENSNSDAPSVTNPVPTPDINQSSNSNNGTPSVATPTPTLAERSVGENASTQLPDFLSQSEAWQNTPPQPRIDMSVAETIHPDALNSLRLPPLRPVVRMPTVSEQIEDSALFGIPRARPTPTRTINLEIKEEENVARQNEMIAQGIPLSPGIQDLSQLTVFDVEGRALPTQVESLGMRYPDGSVRWALVQFEASSQGRRTSNYSLNYGITPPAPAQTIQIRNDESILEVNTGKMKFVINKQSSSDTFLPSQVWANDSGVYSPSDLILNQAPRFDLMADAEHMSLDEFNATGFPVTVLDQYGLNDQTAANRLASKITPRQNYNSIFNCPCQVEVEESGPLRAVFKITKANPTAGSFQFTARLYVYAGKKNIKTEFSLLNTDTAPIKIDREYNRVIVNSKHVKKFTLSLNNNFASEYAQVFSEGREVNFNSNLSLSQINKNQYRLNGAPLPGQNPGWIKIANNAQKSITYSPQWFWEIYPKSFTYTPNSRELKIDFWPEDAGRANPIAAGKQRTYEFMLSFNSPNTPASESAAMRSPLMALPSSEDILASRLTPSFVPITDMSYPKLHTYRQLSLRRFKDQQMLHGDIDYGDTYYDGMLHGDGINPEYARFSGQRWNGYHGVDQELFVDFLSRRDSNTFKLFEAATRQTIDIDTIRTGIDRGGKEMKNGRAYDHVAVGQTGVIYSWNLGPLYYYWLTGKKRVLEDLITTERYLSGAGGTISMLPDRVTSIPFMNIIQMLEAVGNEQSFKSKFGQQFSQASYPTRPKMLNVAENDQHLILMENLIRRYNQSFIARPYATTTNYQGFSMMVQYASEACFSYWKLTQNSEASECVVNAKNYLSNILALPNGMPFYSKEDVSRERSEEWLPYTQETILPAIRAYQVTQDIRHLEQAKAPLDWELNYVGIARMMNAMSYGLQISMGVLREANIGENSLNPARLDSSTLAAIQRMKTEATPHLNSATYIKRNYCTLAYEVARNLINNGRQPEAVSWLTQWSNSPGGCSETRGAYLHIDNFLAKANGNSITPP